MAKSELDLARGHIRSLEKQLTEARGSRDRWKERCKSESQQKYWLLRKYKPAAPVPPLDNSEEFPPIRWTDERPTWAVDPFNPHEDGGRCTKCGEWWEVVRPGKWQPHCNCS